MATRGHCFCGEVSWEYSGDRIWECYCHCDDCRRNCAAPVVAWFGVPRENFKWTGAKTKIYESSKGVHRHFCGTCGTPMGFFADHYPESANLYTATLEDPTEFNPTFHVFAGDQLPWLPMQDELQKYPKSLLHAPSDLRDTDT